MIAEHEFVTTFEQEEALAAATNILRQMGFRVRTDEGRLVAKRGAETPGKAKLERNLPQSIELTYDRGRCHLGASIMTPATTKPIHSNLITTALSTLERVLVHGQTDDEALEAWHRIEGRASVKTKQNKVVLYVLLAVLGLLVMCLIGIAIAAAMDM